jgi:hypothetical protein
MHYEDRRPVWENILELDRYLRSDWDGWWVASDDGSICDNNANSIVRDSDGSYWMIDLNFGEEPQLLGDSVADLDDVLIRAGEILNG